LHRVRNRPRARRSDRAWSSLCLFRSAVSARTRSASASTSAAAAAAAAALATANAFRSAALCAFLHTHAQTIYNTKGTRAHTHRELIREWLNRSMNAIRRRGCVREALASANAFRSAALCAFLYIISHVNRHYKHTRRQHTHARMHTYTRARTHTRAHARGCATHTHARTRTHTHINQ